MKQNKLSKNRSTMLSVCDNIDLSYQLGKNSYSTHAVGHLEEKIARFLSYFKHKHKILN